MFNLPRRHVLPIGLDIGSDTVKLLQCQIVGSGLSVVAAARTALPEEARGESPTRLAVAVAMVRKMIAQHPFVGRRVITCLPPEAVQIRNLRLPLIPPAELPAAIEFEARTVFGFEDSQAVIQFLPAGDVRQGTETRQELIVFGARQIETNNFIEQIHRSGCLLESLDVEPCALFRAFERFVRRREDEKDVQVLVDVGARKTQVIISRGHDLCFFKTIDLGSGNLHEAVSRKLNISIEEARALRHRLMEPVEVKDSQHRDPVRRAVEDATRSVMEELGREIALCLRYYCVTFRGQRPARARVTGAEANDPRLIATLGAGLNISVECGRPLFSIDCGMMRPADRLGSMSEWTLALGLGLKAAHRTFAPYDGRPRSDAVHAPAEVVDLNHAVAEMPAAEVIGA